jgi:hypothetical protein
LKAELSDKEELNVIIKSFKDLNLSIGTKEKTAVPKLRSKSILKSSPPGRAQPATKNKVIIFDESQRIFAETAEDAAQELTIIQKQFPFYSSRSKHGLGSAQGALRNRKPGHVATAREEIFKRN